MRRRTSFICFHCSFRSTMKQINRESGHLFFLCLCRLVYAFVHNLSFNLFGLFGPLCYVRNFHSNPKFQIKASENTALCSCFDISFHIFTISFWSISLFTLSLLHQLIVSPSLSNSKSVKISFESISLFH